MGFWELPVGLTQLLRILKQARHLRREKLQGRLKFGEWDLHFQVRVVFGVIRINMAEGIDW
ncbi:MAG: hypothetical protein DWH73_02760 [Planctomycetota bacterium]|nr:MAG: hypothetical protein DWH73_02760 [Planctomycetota bacterium]